MRTGKSKIIQISRPPVKPEPDYKHRNKLGVTNSPVKEINQYLERSSKSNCRRYDNNQKRCETVVHYEPNHYNSSHSSHAEIYNSFMRCKISQQCNSISQSTSYESPSLLHCQQNQNLRQRITQLEQQCNSYRDYLAEYEQLSQRNKDLEKQLEFLLEELTQQHQPEQTHYKLQQSRTEGSRATIDDSLQFEYCPHEQQQVDIKLWQTIQELREENCVFKETFAAQLKQCIEQWESTFSECLKSMDDKLQQLLVSSSSRIKSTARMPNCSNYVECDDINSPRFEVSHKTNIQLQVNNQNSFKKQVSLVSLIDLGVDNCGESEASASFRKSKGELKEIMDNHENVVSVTSTCKERQSQSIDFILENILEMIIKAKQAFEQLKQEEDKHCSEGQFSIDKDLIEKIKLQLAIFSNKFGQTQRVDELLGDCRRMRLHIAQLNDKIASLAQIRTSADGNTAFNASNIGHHYLNFGYYSQPYGQWMNTFEETKQKLQLMITLMRQFNNSFGHLQVFSQH